MNYKHRSLKSLTSSISRRKKAERSGAFFGRLNAHVRQISIHITACRKENLACHIFFSFRTLFLH
ncbi:hypothetical protein D1AOALGA4SA_3258 [Olavius algarvensis Delta 1 endosymbiont]|nr:hypothetical protein D1AOALGA4SA_3258 [Olavius algarvensis Delta 1 endosymbiont]